MFVLPRGQAPAVTLTTVNMSRVKMTLVRMTERNVAGFMRDYRLGEEIDRWSVDSIAESSGSTVWTGTAEIPKWEPNKPARTALPMPDALANAGPGLYALSAEIGDGCTIYQGYLYSHPLALAEFEVLHALRKNMES
jgi:uncharacterized protein YfaS (alpha-2-macroglobulin family)